uniref:AlNc14C107G6262 protein n=1 Tax=Albugo laibachii Nc14 TaxID=890382 RepID=F0WI55_9STRA|nr:AlNc14C107G6262 [Albugo laibachii Nc14]|eukprot:CCA20933.1 AlNc14C107G6262 [Albugo laibachii Nc14]
MGVIDGDQRQGEATHPCIGLYIDALDSAELWGEAKIIDCDNASRRVKVHFIGFPKRYDIWTDSSRLAASGTHSVCRYGRKKRVWDGKEKLFEESKPTAKNEALTTRKRGRGRGYQPRVPKPSMKLQPKSIDQFSSVQSRANKYGVSETTTRVRKGSTEAADHLQKLSPLPGQAYLDCVSSVTSLETRQRNLEMVKQQNELLDLASLSWKEQLSEEANELTQIL